MAEKMEIGSIEILDNKNLEKIIKIGENYRVENGKINVNLMSIRLSRIEKYRVLSYKEV